MSWHYILIPSFFRGPIYNYFLFSLYHLIYKIFSCHHNAPSSHMTVTLSQWWSVLMSAQPPLAQSRPMARYQRPHPKGPERGKKKTCIFLFWFWRHNGRGSVSNHQPHDCLLNRLFRCWCRSKKTSKLRVTGLCVENSSGTGEFPAQMASNAENVSISWRHHVATVITKYQ